MILHRANFEIEHNGTKYDIQFSSMQGKTYIFLSSAPFADNAKVLFSADIIVTNSESANMLLQAYLFAKNNPLEETIKHQS